MYPGKTFRRQILDVDQLVHLSFSQCVRRLRTLFLAKDLQIDISDITSTSKSKWKKKVKGNAIDRIRKRMKEDIHEKTKCCTIKNDKWERKQNIKKLKVIP